MATTLKNIDTTFYRENPNGTHEEENDLIQYKLYYDTTRKAFVIHFALCTNGKLGYRYNWEVFNHAPIYVMRVTKYTDKRHLACINWFKANIDTLHDVFLASGYEGVKHAVADLVKDISV